MLGTQDKSFTRLLSAIDASQLASADAGNQLVVQAGYTAFKPSSDMELFDFCSADDLERHLQEADLVITHAGVGSIVSALTHHKRVIAAARKAAYKEMGNDHQSDILQAFARAGYLIALEDFDRLDDAVTEALRFTPKPYVRNIDGILETITTYIDTH